jgi:hypothetical protein
MIIQNVTLFRPRTEYRLRESTSRYTSYTPPHAVVRFSVYCLPTLYARYRVVAGRLVVSMRLVQALACAIVVRTPYPDHDPSNTIHMPLIIRDKQQTTQAFRLSTRSLRGNSSLDPFSGVRLSYAESRRRLFREDLETNHQPQRAFHDVDATARAVRTEWCRDL